MTIKVVSKWPSKWPVNDHQGGQYENWPGGFQRYGALIKCTFSCWARIQTNFFAATYRSRSVMYFSKLLIDRFCACLFLNTENTYIKISSGFGFNVKNCTSILRSSSKNWSVTVSTDHFKGHLLATDWPLAKINCEFAIRVTRPFQQAIACP